MAISERAPQPSSPDPQQEHAITLFAGEDCNLFRYHETFAEFVGQVMVLPCQLEMICDKAQYPSDL